MFEHIVLPRLSETDALGHINNTVLPAWFEEARRDLFELFIPQLQMDRWNLILKKYEVEIVHQISHQQPVRIVTELEKIGETSLIVVQHASQLDVAVAAARTVLIHFDYHQQAPASIPSSVRVQLEPHLQGEK